MLKEDPTNLRTKTAVAGSCYLLGRVTFSLGDLAATREYYRRALELRQAVHAEDPTSVSAATFLAGAFDALGDVELKTGPTHKAQEYYESAVTLLDEIFEKDPNNAAVKANLSTLYYKVATTYLRLDDPATAGPIYAQCLELREELLAADPNDPNKQISVILARARCGLHRQAATLADQLRAKADDNAGTLFYVACGYALCAGTVSTSENEDDRSLEGTYVDSALEALKQAVTLGYHDVVALQSDPDLDPLRTNDDFQQLVAEIERNS
jgi:tetratricopeptide (TPR) repeat protein